MDLGQSSVIKYISKWIAPERDNFWLGSRSQTSDRIDEWLVEFIQSSPLQSPVECLTNISASPSKFEIVLIVGHRVLDKHKRESEVRFRRVG